MNMPVKVEYFKNPKNRDLTPAELEAFAKELDQIKQEVLDDLGEKTLNISAVSMLLFVIVAFRPSLFICRLVPASVDFRYGFIRFL